MNILDIESGNPYKKTLNQINETRLSATYESGISGLLRFHQDSTKTETITIDRDCVVNLMGHTLTNYRFVVDNGASVTFRNGKLTNTSKRNILNVKRGKCTLSDILIEGSAQTGYGSTNGLVSVGYQYSRTELQSYPLYQLKDFAPILIIEKDATISAKGTSSGCIGESSIYTAAIADMISYVQKPRIDIYGSVLCEGPIGIWEWGTDIVGTDVNVYDGAILSCSYETAISKINGGSINLYGGEIYGGTGICMRYMNSLNVPLDSTVKVTGNGTKSPYPTTGTSWDNDEHLWQTGHALAIDRNYRTQKFAPVVNILGGTWTSTNNLAIGSYPYQNAQERLVGFISSTATLVNGIPSSGNPYDETTGDNADYGIMK